MSLRFTSTGNSTFLDRAMYCDLLDVRALCRKMMLNYKAWQEARSVNRLVDKTRAKV